MAVAESLLIGLIGAVIGWGAAQALLGPRLAFSHQVSVISSDHAPSEELPRVKFHNLSRFRSVVDLQVQAKLYIPNLVVGNRGATLAVTLETSVDAVNRIAPRNVVLATIDTCQMSSFHRMRLLDHGLDAFVENDSPTLRDWLAIEPADGEWQALSDEKKCSFDRPFLVLVVSCADAWSGARRTRLTPHYHLDDVENYNFVAHTRRSTKAVNKAADLIRLPHAAITRRRGKCDRILQIDKNKPSR